jgi:hypothetical protein
MATKESKEHKTERTRSNSPRQRLSGCPCSNRGRLARLGSGVSGATPTQGPRGLRKWLISRISRAEKSFQEMKEDARPHPSPLPQERESVVAALAYSGALCWLPRWMLNDQD